MAVRFAVVILFLVMVCGTPIQKFDVDVAVLEEILKAVKVEDLDLEDVLSAMAKQCPCKENRCLCCDSVSVFATRVDVCLEVTHALGMFKLKLQVSDKKYWDEEIADSSVKKLVGKSQTVQVSGQFGSVKGSGTITFHDIQMTPRNVASSCVDGMAVFERKGRVESVSFNLGCFTV